MYTTKAKNDNNESICIAVSLVQQDHSRHTHTDTLTQTPTWTGTMYMIPNESLACKEGLTTEGDHSVREENMVGLLFLKKTCFKVWFEWRNKISVCHLENRSN